MFSNLRDSSFFSFNGIGFNTVRIYLSIIWTTQTFLIILLIGINWLMTCLLFSLLFKLLIESNFWIGSRIMSIKLCQLRQFLFYKIIDTKVPKFQISSSTSTSTLPPQAFSITPLQLHYNFIHNSTSTNIFHNSTPTPL